VNKLLIDRVCQSPYFSGPSSVAGALLRRGQRMRIDELDARITPEIGGIKSEHMRQTVALHRGNQPGVVRLFAGNAALANNLVPPLQNAAFVPKD